MVLGGMIGWPVAAAPPEPGVYDAWLESRGGRVAFTLEVEPGLRAARVTNGEEVIRKGARVEGESLVIPFEPYGAELRVRASEVGGELRGEWVRRRKVDEYTTVAFGGVPRAPLPLVRPIGFTLPERWTIRFAAAEPEDASDVGVFRMMPDGRVHGTILTTTGDWRYLHGTLGVSEAGRRLELSSFSGSGATLIRAEISEDGRVMRGRSYSGGGEAREFVAHADEGAALPDDFTLTRAVGRPDFDALAFTDPATGERVSLASFLASGARGPMLIHLFGSWCPNSNDAAELMNEVCAAYAARGLVVVGLAFEGTGDAALDRERVAAFCASHGAAYPVLMAAGETDKKKASALLPFLDRVHAYPTSVLIDRRGRISAIHTGFSGPATGEAQASMRRRVMAEIERIVGE